MVDLEKGHHVARRAVCRLFFRFKPAAPEMTLKTFSPIGVAAAAMKFSITVSCENSCGI
jgi:hypothetical protein